MTRLTTFPQVPGKIKLALNDFLGETNNRSDTENLPPDIPTRRRISCVYLKQGVRSQGALYSKLRNNNSRIRRKSRYRNDFWVSLIPHLATAYSTGALPPFIEDAKYPYGHERANTWPGFCGPSAQSLSSSHQYIIMVTTNKQYLTLTPVCL